MTCQPEDLAFDILLYRSDEWRPQDRERIKLAYRRLRQQNARLRRLLRYDPDKLLPLLVRMRGDQRTVYAALEKLTRTTDAIGVILHGEHPPADSFVPEVDLEIEGEVIADEPPAEAPARPQAPRRPRPVRE
jgi:hypothetical protein